MTDAVLEEVAEWQNRPLDALYAVVFFDALRVKIRDEGTVRNKAIYVALGMRPDGTYQVCWLGYSQRTDLDRSGGERTLWDAGIPWRDCQ